MTVLKWKVNGALVELVPHVRRLSLLPYIIPPLLYVFPVNIYPAGKTSIDQHQNTTYTGLASDWSPTSKYRLKVPQE